MVLYGREHRKSAATPHHTHIHSSRNNSTISPHHWRHYSQNDAFVCTKRPLSNKNAGPFGLRRRHPQTQQDNKLPSRNFPGEQQRGFGLRDCRIFWLNSQHQANKRNQQQKCRRKFSPLAKSGIRLQLIAVEHQQGAKTGFN